VAADAFNSEVLAPLLEGAHPRSGDEAGCNPQVAADLALVYIGMPMAGAAVLLGAVPSDSHGVGDRLI
jgi:hypothetical protein